VTTLRLGADRHFYTAATTTVTDTPLALRNAGDYMIARHPKVLSTVSTALTIVGGIILFPGVTACASGTILAHPAVTIAGGIALAVGRRLRRALNSAAALAAAQAQAQASRQAGKQASRQVTTVDVDENRDGTEPEGLLSVDFVV
jgi:orotidine-5'-phosphate decarboxylase